MSQPFTLPLWFAPHLHSPADAALLDLVCAPIDRAEKGDVVGVDLRFILCNGFVELLPIKQLFTFVGGDRIEQASLFSLPGSIISKISEPLLRLQCSISYNAIVTKMCNKLEVESGQCIDVMLMPHAAIASQDEYTDSIFEGRHKGIVTQEAIDEAILAVHVGLPRTAHEKIEAQTELGHLLNLVNTNVPVPHPDNIYLDADLILPDINSIQVL
jgi:hypothetical protein